MARGSPAILITSSISAVMLALAAFSLLLVLLPTFSRTRQIAFHDEA